MHHFAHRAEALHGVVADKAVDLNELLVGEPEISLANGYQHVAVLALGPDSESIVGIIGRALAVTARGKHQHRIDAEWIALPSPPRALATAGQIGRIAALEHYAFGRFGIGAGTRGCGVFACDGEIVPSGERHQG